MNQKSLSIYNKTLQISVILLSLALFWFAFIFYPKVIGDLKSESIFTRNPFVSNVAASGHSLPLETAAYRITYENKSDTYYVVVKADNLAQFVYNQESARLALKSVLSLEKLCNLNVIYVAPSSLTIPQKYLDNTGC